MTIELGNRLKGLFKLPTGVNPADNASYAVGELNNGQNPISPFKIGRRGFLKRASAFVGLMGLNPLDGKKIRENVAMLMPDYEAGVDGEFETATLDPKTIFKLVGQTMNGKLGFDFVKEALTRTTGELQAEIGLAPFVNIESPAPFSDKKATVRWHVPYSVLSEFSLTLDLLNNPKVPNEIKDQIRMDPRVELYPKILDRINQLYRNPYSEKSEQANFKACEKHNRDLALAITEGATPQKPTNTTPNQPVILEELFITTSAIVQSVFGNIGEFPQINTEMLNMLHPRVLACLLKQVYLKSNDKKLFTKTDLVNLLPHFTSLFYTGSVLAGGLDAILLGKHSINYQESAKILLALYSGPTNLLTDGGILANIPLEALGAMTREMMPSEIKMTDSSLLVEINPHESVYAEQWMEMLTRQAISHPDLVLDILANAESPHANKENGMMSVVSRYYFQKLRERAVKEPKKYNEMIKKLEGIAWNKFKDIPIENEQRYLSYFAVWSSIYLSGGALTNQSKTDIGLNISENDRNLTSQKVKFIKGCGNLTQWGVQFLIHQLNACDPQIDPTSGITQTLLEIVGFLDTPEVNLHYGNFLRGLVNYLNHDYLIKDIHSLDNKQLTALLTSVADSSPVATGTLLKSLDKQRIMDAVENIKSEDVLQKLNLGVIIYSYLYQGKPLLSTQISDYDKNLNDSIKQWTNEKDYPRFVNALKGFFDAKKLKSLLGVVAGPHDRDDLIFSRYLLTFWSNFTNGPLEFGNELMANGLSAVNSDGTELELSRILNSKFFQDKVMRVVKVSTKNFNGKDKPVASVVITHNDTDRTSLTNVDSGVLKSQFDEFIEYMSTFQDFIFVTQGEKTTMTNNDYKKMFEDIKNGIPIDILIPTAYFLSLSSVNPNASGALVLAEYLHQTGGQLRRLNPDRPLQLYSFNNGVPKTEKTISDNPPNILGIYTGEDNMDRQSYYLHYLNNEYWVSFSDPNAPTDAGKSKIYYAKASDVLLSLSDQEALFITNKEKIAATIAFFLLVESKTGLLSKAAKKLLGLVH